MNEPIDLDANATTPLLPAARDAMFSLSWLGNAASSHSLGRKARKHLEDARERIAARLGAHPDEVIFTSGATEANNLAIFGIGGRAKHVLASPMEHPCALEPVRKLAADLKWLPVSPEGVVRPEGAADFAVLQLVNHETGAIQPVCELAARMPLHCDAAQAVGKMPVHFRELGAVSLAASAHKFRGPVGIGVLLLMRGTQLQPLFFGGHQQQGRRPGTESPMLAVGMAVALDHAVEGIVEHQAKLRALRARLWERLLADASPVVRNGPEDAMPTTLTVSFPGCRGDLLLMALDLAGVACSTGSACSSGSLLPSPVLQAMGVPDDVLRSAIRFSFGPELELETMEEAARRIAIAVRKLRGV
ncbi:MAG: cysteine desulfurase family protein [Gemmataceae bacterium]